MADSQTAAGIHVPDLEKRVDALSRRLTTVENENQQLREALRDAREERSENRQRIEAVESDTDLLRIIDRTDDLTAEQSRASILQHMWRAVRGKPGDERLHAMDTSKVHEILHYPDVDRTTVLRWMRTTPRLVGNEDVCWYDGGDPGPGGRPARICLDLRGAGESLVENVKRQTRRSNNT